MRLTEQSHARIALGGAVYDRGEDVLRDAAGAVLVLRPQSAQALRLLAKHIGQTVTKDMLIDDVWAGMSVTDDSLVQCIADIRRAIGDTTRQILRTVPKKGYCLTALPVEPAPAASPHIRQELVAAALDLANRVGAMVCARLDPTAPLSIQTIRAGLQPILDAQSAIAVSSLPPFTCFACPTPAQAIAVALSVQTWCAASGVGVAIGIDMSNGTEQARASDLAIFASYGDTIVPAAVAQLLTTGLDCDIVDLGDHALSPDTEHVRCFKVSAPAAAPALRMAVSREDLLPTIAVIPFQSRDLSPDAAVLGEVLADDVITSLARSLEINVISRLSSTKFSQRAASLSEIGTHLGTNYVLTGRYTARASSLEVFAELSEVATGRVLWADSERAEVEQSFDAPEIIDWIVARVQKAIYTRAVQQVRQQPLPTLDSYTLLMSAVALMHRLSPDDFNKAKLLLEAVIERAPNQASPLAWLSRWHVLRVQQGWSLDPVQDAQLAFECTKRALDMDPENVLALVSEGVVMTNLMQDMDTAQERYDLALDISPNDADARLLRGTMYAFRGEGTRAMRDTERSLRLTPIDPLRFYFLSLAASACIAAEDYDRALELSDLSLRANSTHTSTLRVKAVALMRMKREDEARATGEKLMRLQPNLSVTQWLKNSPSGDFDIGRKFGETLIEIGVPL